MCNQSSRPTKNSDPLLIKIVHLHVHDRRHHQWDLSSGPPTPLQKLLRLKKIEKKKKKAKRKRKSEKIQKVQKVQKSKKSKVQKKAKKKEKRESFCVVPTLFKPNRYSHFFEPRILRFLIRCSKLLMPISEVLFLLRKRVRMEGMCSSTKRAASKRTELDE